LYGDKMITSSWTAKLKEQPLALYECSFKTHLPSVSVDRVLHLQFASAFYRDMGIIQAITINKATSPIRLDKTVN
jgi:hypothetical protein